MFKEIGVADNIVKAITEIGFETPTRVQQEVIPLLLEDRGRDIIALAQTGTGKTAAFGIPILQNLDVKKKKVQVLILSPTRELCLQIADDIADYAKYIEGVKVAAVFGGASMERQIKAVKSGAQIVSATPGRLLDLINRGVINIMEVDTVVLDEADEMLNMGFRDDLVAILAETPEDKNMLLFSATMPEEINRIVKNYMDEPVEIVIGKKNSGAENVEHICYMVYAKERYLALKRIVDFNPEIYGIIFCRTRRETQEVADHLMRDGYNADALHGDLSQAQRDQVMNKFRIKHLQLLVATDVAARGLDVDNLTHIINYSLPEELELYTHRSGRTGRAGRVGTSIVIATIKEKHLLKKIEKQINKKFTTAEMPDGKKICERQLFHLIDRMEKVEVDHSQIEAYLPDINRKLEWLERDELIMKFVSVEFNRFLDYYKNTPELSVQKDVKSTGKSFRDEVNFKRFFINLGKTDNLKPGTLMGLINDFTGFADIQIGEIDIQRNFSFFQADSEYSDTIISAFENKDYRGREISVELSENNRRGNSDRRGDRQFSGGKKRFSRGFSGGSGRSGGGSGRGFGFGKSRRFEEFNRKERKFEGRKRGKSGKKEY
ncbi:MAG: DEAD/DEAH box helicase [Ignavibacteriales bacterium]|nr:MAG: DEAD/DEAH box helicase [Ignavibacteriaceae bacterium]MBW7874092.1 DEAD/DEAH box helicase [Ignavibacteria bacterium]MCZ2143192.1 DEAD/DEAH box helicase [Ignavibacteriales bacterium]MBV6444072.1 ATP-dependent RNA helicase DeaD [Ignavibacteriaceae bacterium]MBZ0196077.1 DEAD/DEAH box helicase [Ignavibacteriaceae bacterium]